MFLKCLELVFICVEITFIWHFSHELVGANAITKLMEIDHTEGIITVAVDDAFDYDRINPVIFQVQAIDAVGHTTTVSVTINLLDVNNKAPTYKVVSKISFVNIKALF